MGLFSSECKHCGSKEHSSSDCPHGLFSSKCKHCGSVEHSSSDCPHGIFSTKCKHCGSVDHSSDDCPHGLFSSKCKHCESTEHSSNDCPHGIFSTKCKHCGSVNHSSNDCPQGGLFSTIDEQSYSSSSSSSDSDAITWIIKIAFILAAGAFVLYLAFIALIFALLISPLALLIYYLYSKRKNKLWAIGAIAISGFIFINLLTNGFLTEPLEGDKSLIKLIGLGYFIVFITTIGFYFEKYSSTTMPVSEKGNLFTQKEIIKRRPLIAGLGALLIGFYSIFSFVDFSSSKPNNNTYQKTKQQNIRNTNSVNNNNNTVKPIENKNKNNNTANNTIQNSNSSNNSTVENEKSIDFSNNIRSLLIAEESRDFNKIKIHYANNIYTYWNVNNIGYDELKNQYEKSWKITLNAKNKIQSINKINTKTYVLNTIFEFYHIKQKKNKSIKSSVRFEFDNNGKIIKVYENK